MAQSPNCLLAPLSAKIFAQIETAVVGRDGAFNAGSALDGKVSLNKAVVQFAGVASVSAAEWVLFVVFGASFVIMIAEVVWWTFRF